MKKYPQKQVVGSLGKYVTRDEFNKLEKCIASLEKFVFKGKVAKGSK